LQAYEKEGFEFLLKAFNDPTFLEDLTGLSKLHAETEASANWDLEGDDDF